MFGAIEFGTTGEQEWGFQKRFDGLGDRRDFRVLPQRNSSKAFSSNAGWKDSEEVRRRFGGGHESVGGKKLNLGT